MNDHCDSCGGPLADGETDTCDGCRLTHEELVEEITPECPACGGPGQFLGTLGTLDHFTCRNCGIPFHRTEETPHA